MSFTIILKSFDRCTAVRCGATSLSDCIQKHNNCYQNWGFAIKEAEKYQYLKGCISALFSSDNCNPENAQQITARLNLLKILINNADDDYHFVKVLISNLPDNFQLTSRISLLRKEKNWKELIVKHFKQAFRNTRDANIADTNGRQYWVHLLATTKLLNNSRNDEKILGSYYGKIVLYGTSGCTWNAYGNVILDEIHNLPCLTHLISSGEISKNEPVLDTTIFSEWNVHFYKGDNEFHISEDGKLFRRQDKVWIETPYTYIIDKDTSDDELWKYLNE